jgi:hypothetical protein
MGNIGKPVRHIELEPLPEEAPVAEPSPDIAPAVEPAPV